MDRRRLDWLLAAGLAALVLAWQPGLPAPPTDVPLWERTGVLPGGAPEAWPAAASPNVGVEVHVAAVGDGEAVLVRCPAPGGGRAALIGAGGVWAGPRVTAYLDHVGVRRLEALIIAHDAPYHVGGLPSVLRRIPTVDVYDAVRTSTEPAHLEAVQVVRALGVGYRQLSGGSEIDLGCATIEALTPLAAGNGEGAPAGPLVGTGAALLIRDAAMRVLLAGALGADGEEALTRVYPDLRADVLVVGGRGVKDATSAVFLERLAPRLAVIPVGPYNEEGRPHAEVLARLEAAGARVYRTDRDGTVVLRATARGPRIHLPLLPQPGP
ncbi:MAG TPA: hypothetical protein VF282_00420 [Bacillota bacterium]